MSDGPTVDDRTREELFEDLRRRAETYTDEWDPHTEDGGTTLTALFARFGADVVDRLNDVPYKHRVAFLDALGFDRRPPQSARVPLTFTTTADIDGNVVVPGGTQVTAETDDGATEIFEIPEEDGFEATPATLEAVYSVDPGSNSIYEHSGVLEAGTERRLFSGADAQSHEFYLGHEELLNVDRGSTLTVSFRTPSRDTLEERVEWEYFGVAPDENGAPGWHPLPLATEETFEDPLDEEVSLAEKMRRVSEEVQQLGEAGGDETDERRYEPTFRFPGPTEPSSVAGVECRWIRGRIPGEEPSDFGIEIESARMEVNAGEGTETLRPGMVFTNDVPVSVEDGDFYPLGKMPQPPTTLYLSCEEAFTKRGGVVDVRFGAPEEADLPSETGTDDGGDDRRITPVRSGPLAGPPEISWEYWNGNGWTRLALETDETSAFTAAGRVRFAVPEDLDATSVSGHEDYWIRARLVGGNYGQPEYELTSQGTRGDLVREPKPPVYGDVTVSYAQRDAPFQAAVTHNNASSGEARLPDDEEAGPLVPFRALPDEDQTVYLGFDAGLADGPVNLYVPMADKAYPSGFEPGVRWEYCANPEGPTWEKLNIYDGTEGLTERGIVKINFPEETAALERFGERRHWIRARVTRDEFVEGVRREPTDGRDDAAVERFDADGRPDQYAETPPTVGGIYPNTQWAYNELTVREVVGSSDGAPGQTFGCDRVPITEASVWVDESGDLPESDRRDLERRRPDDVRRESTAGGDDEFWVRWTEVTDFLDSGESSRHYRLDRTSGTVTFGDGRAGAIPPIGDRNVEVVYQTGGGSEGNIDAGSVVDLRSSISLIDEVTNLEQSDGGTDTESLEETVSRAPERIKNRGRAVSVTDFEHIARDASRELATVKCEPQMDEAGDRTPGWVTLLIIPRERRDRPTPSLELRQRVRDAVGERAPATLVDASRNRIVVRGPEYAEASVEATVDTRGVESITNLRNTIEASLEAFFHPLTGGDDGEGWSFGTAPRLSRLSTLVEAAEGVDRVRNISMTVETASEEKIIRDPERTPVLSRDEMISSGTHDIDVIMRGQR